MGLTYNTWTYAQLRWKQYYTNFLNVQYVALHPITFKTILPYLFNIKYVELRSITYQTYYVDCFLQNTVANTVKSANAYLASATVHLVSLQKSLDKKNLRHTAHHRLLFRSHHGKQLFNSSSSPVLCRML